MEIIRTYVHIHVTACLNAKKGGETSKSNILRLLGMANMQRRQDRHGLVMMAR